MQELTFLVVVLFIFAAGSIIYFTLKNGISPMISSYYARNAVASEIRKLSNVHTILDIGSGWGTLAIYLTNRFPDKKMIGLENSWIPYWVSQWIRVVFSYSNLSFHRKNLYTYDFRQTELVVCYLYPGAMERLSKLFQHQLMDGTLIISICFALPGWQPVRTIQCKDMFRTKIYVYVK